VLTVDYERLGLTAGQLVLDLGCGFGRHAYEAMRRGARVVACDLALPELTEVRSTAYAMVQSGQVEPEIEYHAVSGDAQALPFPDSTFDRVIASEVLEHVPDDRRALAELVRVLKPGGTIAATVPSYLPERICWALSDEYHAPAAVGGHVRIYAKRDLESLMQVCGVLPFDHHRAHALHSPYWWLKCAVGIDNEDNPLVRQYLRLLTWDITEGPALTRIADRVLRPVLGKSLVIYARRPANTGAGPRPESEAEPEAAVR
jgi:ubiquinone/menaquinone biosynthesis C-methylase UbiE